MRKLFPLLFSILCLAFHSTLGQSPVSINGKLKLVDNLQLSSECGKPVQLRGMSSHGLQWQSDCIAKPGALDSLKKSWGSDLVRLALYVEEGGYITSPAEYRDFIDLLVDEVGKMGLYVMIDWHILKDNDPNKNIELAKEFWDYMSKKHKGKKHVIYEICNEPNGKFVTWSVIAKYARVIIPIIRANDPETIIVVGTPEWSGRPSKVYEDPLLEFSNVMYAFHFYAGTHSFLLDELKFAARELPIFASEWGTGTSDGKGTPNVTVTNQFIDIFNGANDSKQTISWANWSFSQVNEGSAALLPGSCDNSSWNNVSASGTLVKSLMNTPDNFIACPLGINDKEVSDAGLSLYPNPANNNLTLQSESFDLTGKVVSIYNSFGVKVSEHVSHSKQLEMDVKDLSNGLYSVKIHAGGKELNLKWIKN